MAPTSSICVRYFEYFWSMEKGAIGQGCSMWIRTRAVGEFDVRKLKIPEEQWAYGLTGDEEPSDNEPSVIFSAPGAHWPLQQSHWKPSL